LGEYYFDVETYSPELKPNPLKDKIIAITYCRLRTEDGSPRGDLRILTEWDCGSEKLLLTKFKDVFLTPRDFDFVPIGVNLYGFDLIAIMQRMNDYFGSNLGFKFLRDRPTLDIKPILVMMNITNPNPFRDYQAVLRGQKQLSRISEWYEAEDYPSIVRYIHDEADMFIRAYQILKEEVPRIKLR
jgi:DNA polymerase elongation subunit (family B)